MDPSPSNVTPKNISEQELLELAKKELLRDVKCASARAEQFGAHSWAKPQKFIPNRRFLRHMLVSASNDNLRREQRLKRKSSKITSAKIRQSHKHENSPKQKKKRKKQSRWESSPDESKTRSLQKSKDKRNAQSGLLTKVKKKKK